MCDGALLLVALNACGGDSTGPGLEPEVTNVADDFQLQVSALSNESLTRQYTWSNSGTTANVTQSPAGAGTGTATLIIRDNAGAEVYRRSLSENGTFVTSGGAAGTWTVRIEVTSYSGTLNFRAQKGG